MQVSCYQTVTSVASIWEKSIVCSIVMQVRVSNTVDKSKTVVAINGVKNG